MRPRAPRGGLTRAPSGSSGRGVCVCRLYQVRLHSSGIVSSRGAQRRGDLATPCLIYEIASLALAMTTSRRQEDLVLLVLPVVVKWKGGVVRLRLFASLDLRPPPVHPPLPRRQRLARFLRRVPEKQHLDAHVLVQKRPVDAKGRQLRFRALLWGSKHEAGIPGQRRRDRPAVGEFDPEGVVARPNGDGLGERARTVSPCQGGGGRSRH